MVFLQCGIIDNLPDDFLSEMKHILSFVDDDGDLELTQFSSDLGCMFAKSVDDCINLFKSYLVVYPHIDKTIGNLKTQLRSYINREQSRRSNNTKKRSFVAPNIRDVIGGSIKQSLSEVYKSSDPPSSQPKRAAIKEKNSAVGCEKNNTMVFVGDNRRQRKELHDSTAIVVEDDDDDDYAEEKRPYVSKKMKELYGQRMGIAREGKNRQ